MIKLGLVNVFVLYCSGNPKESSKSKQNLVTGFQINFIWVYPNQFDLLKVLRGGIRKNLEFDLPYYIVRIFVLTRHTMVTFALVKVYISSAMVSHKAKENLANTESNFIFTQSKLVITESGYQIIAEIFLPPPLLKRR